jgi:hypothetical protein
VWHRDACAVLYEWHLQRLSYVHPQALYDKKADSLKPTLPWGSRHVLLNPPFCRSMLKKFVARALDEVTRGAALSTLTLPCPWLRSTRCTRSLRLLALPCL